MQVFLEDVLVPENETWVEISKELKKVEVEVKRREVREREGRKYESVSQVD